MQYQLESSSLENHILKTLNLLEKSQTCETHVSQIRFTDLDFIDYISSLISNNKRKLFKFKENTLNKAYVPAHTTLYV